MTTPQHQQDQRYPTPPPPSGPSWPTVTWGMIAALCVGFVVASQISRDPGWAVDWRVFLLVVGGVMLLIPLVALIRPRSPQGEDLELPDHQPGQSGTEHSGAEQPWAASHASWENPQPLAASQPSGFGEVSETGQIAADPEGQQIGEQDGGRGRRIEDGQA